MHLLAVGRAVAAPSAAPSETAKTAHRLGDRCRRSSGSIVRAVQRRRTKANKVAACFEPSTDTDMLNWSR